MTGNEFLTYVRGLTKTTATTFTNDEIKTSLNSFLPELSQDINFINEDILAVFADRDLEAGVREYPVPEDFNSKYIMIEAKLREREDSDLKWVELFETDLTRTTNTTDEDGILERYGNSRGKAMFDFIRQGIYILSGEIEAVENGLKFVYQGEISKIADLAISTDLSLPPSSPSDSWKHGIPSVFHRLLGRQVSVDFKSSTDRKIPITEDEKRIDMDREKILYKLRVTNSKRHLDLTPPFTVSETGNDGFNF